MQAIRPKVTAADAGEMMMQPQAQIGPSHVAAPASQFAYGRSDSASSLQATGGSGSGKRGGPGIDPSKYRPIATTDYLRELHSINDAKRSLATAETNWITNDRFRDLSVHKSSPEAALIGAKAAVGRALLKLRTVEILARTRTLAAKAAPDYHSHVRLAAQQIPSEHIAALSKKLEHLRHMQKMETELLAERPKLDGAEKRFRAKPTAQNLAALKERVSTMELLRLTSSVTKKNADHIQVPEYGS